MTLPINQIKLFVPCPKCGRDPESIDMLHCRHCGAWLVTKSDIEISINEDIDPKETLGVLKHGYSTK